VLFCNHMMLILDSTTVFACYVLQRFLTKLCCTTTTVNFEGECSGVMEHERGVMVHEALSKNVWLCVSELVCVSRVKQGGDWVSASFT